MREYLRVKKKNMKKCEYDEAQKALRKYAWDLFISQR